MTIKCPQCKRNFKKEIIVGIYRKSLSQQPKKKIIVECTHDDCKHKFTIEV